MQRRLNLPFLCLAGWDVQSTVFSIALDLVSLFSVLYYPTHIHHICQLKKPKLIKQCCESWDNASQEMVTGEGDMEEGTTSRRRPLGSSCRIEEAARRPNSNKANGCQHKKEEGLWLAVSSDRCAPASPPPEPGDSMRSDWPETG